MANFDCIALPDSIACMRLHGESKSVSSGVKFAAEIIRVANKMIDNPHLYPRYEIVPSKILSFTYIAAARFLFMNGAYLDALSYLISSARMSRAYHKQILLNEMPRYIARIILGHRLYQRVNSLFARVVLG
jgi:hypothetical protein